MTLQPALPPDPEEDRENSPEVFAAMVHDGLLTPENLDTIRDDLRDLAEEALRNHRDRVQGPCPCERKMGRPSQGRSHRLQAMITPDQAAWLESQRQPGEKSVSEVVFRLLENLRNL